MASTDTSSLASRLRHARACAGLTQSQLAKAAGVEQPLVSQIERGVVRRSAVIAQLAVACGVDAAWLSMGVSGSQCSLAHEVPTLDRGLPKAGNALKELQEGVAAKVAALMQSGGLDEAGWKFLDDTLLFLGRAGHK